MPKGLKIGALGILLIALIFIFFFLDPEKLVIFPKCPFLQLTGYQCPGCGSQRAIHHLLHFQVGKAFVENALFVVFIPYLFLGFLLILWENNPMLAKIKRVLFNKQSVIIILSIIILFWVGRNLF